MSRHDCEEAPLTGCWWFGLYQVLLTQSPVVGQRPTSCGKKKLAFISFLKEEKEGLSLFRSRDNGYRPVIFLFLSLSLCLCLCVRKRRVKPLTLTFRPGISSVLCVCVWCCVYGRGPARAFLLQSKVHQLLTTKRRRKFSSRSLDVYIYIFIAQRKSQRKRY